MESYVGKLVEIRSKADGFVGSYYEAKLLSRKSENKFLVEYTTLFQKEDGLEPLTEIVEAFEIRPLPPTPTTRGLEFERLDKVDAYDNDGWWVGTVTGSDGQDFYYVYFPGYGVELKYPVSRLRPHMSYKKGHWIPYRRTLFLRS